MPKEIRNRPKLLPPDVLNSETTSPEHLKDKRYLDSKKPRTFKIQKMHLFSF